MPLYFAYGSNMDRRHAGPVPGFAADRHRPPDAAPLFHFGGRLCVGGARTRRSGLGIAVGSGPRGRAGARSLREPVDRPLHQGHPARPDRPGPRRAIVYVGRSAKPGCRSPAIWKESSRLRRRRGLPADYIGANSKSWLPHPRRRRPGSAGEPRPSAPAAFAGRPVQGTLREASHPLPNVLRDAS